MTIVELEPRSDQALTAFEQDGWDGLAAFRSSVSVSCSPVQAALYAGCLEQVWKGCQQEPLPSRREIWLAAEELAWDGWEGTPEQLIEAARFVSASRISPRWPLEHSGARLTGDAA